MSEPLVVIGNGMAAMHLVEELTKRALGRYAIAVIGEEPRLAYNRVLLSAVLAREVSRSDIELRPARWWSHRGVTLLYGRTACAIDPAIRRVRLADGATLPYAKVVLATGSRPIRLNVPGMELPGVMTFRDLGDVASIEAAAQRRARAVVIGGGLLGLEAAYGLAKAGVRVTILHLMDRLMERQLDAHGASMLKRAVEARGIAVQLDAETVGIRGRGRAQSVVLKDGKHIEADLVVVAAGIRPNVELAHGADLGVDRGILVDDHLQTSRPGIYAIGECAEHRGVVTDLRAGLRTGTGTGARLPAKRTNIPAACLPPISRCLALTCFPLAISSARQAPNNSCSRILASALTRNSSSAAADLSARFCLAIPRTGFGISISFALAPQSRRSAMTSCLAVRWLSERRRDVERFQPRSESYLEGFASGLNAARAARGKGAWRSSRRAGGPDAIHIRAQDRVLAAGGKLADQEKFKRELHPFDGYERLKDQAAGTKPPSQPTIFAGASTGCST